jgi:hypothetical protein
VTGLWQVLGYVLMDYVDEYAVTDVALFSARYGYLAQWNLSTLLPQLARRPVTTAALRAEFRALLEACRADGRASRAPDRSLPGAVLVCCAEGLQPACGDRVSCSARDRGNALTCAAASPTESPQVRVIRRGPHKKTTDTTALGGTRQHDAKVAQRSY